MTRSDTTRSQSARLSLADDSRGQILFVTTVTVVLIMFTMALAVNTAGVTERERSNGVEYQQQEATAHLSATVYAVEQAVEHVNHNTTLSDTTAKKSRLTDSGGEIDAIDERLSTQFAVQRGQINITTQSTNEAGIRFWSPVNSTFEVEETVNGSQQARSEYTLFEDSDATRDFAVEITGHNLTSGTTNAFTVETTSGGTSSTYSVYESDSSTNEVTIENASGTTCTGQNVTTDDSLSISFSDGTVGGDYCEILPATESISAVDVSNADNASGSLSAVAETDTPDVSYITDDTNRSVLDTPTEDPSQIQAHKALYSVTVSITTTTPQADVTTTVRITPGLYATAETRYE